MNTASGGSVKPATSSTLIALARSRSSPAEHDQGRQQEHPHSGLQEAPVQAHREEAQRLGLCGWVRNEADGSVSAVAEGDEATVKKLVEWCQQGPPLAEVTEVVVSEASPEGLEGFTVR